MIKSAVRKKIVPKKDWSLTRPPKVITTFKWDERLTEFEEWKKKHPSSGVSKRTALFEEKVGKIKNLHDEGKNPEQIAEVVGASVRGVKYILNRLK